MRMQSIFVVAVTVGFLSAASLRAQVPLKNPPPEAPGAASAEAGQAPEADNAKPQALGPDGKPLPPPAKVKEKKKKKEKAPKLTPVSITRGILTVDGWTGKAALNYDIADLKYIYISSPGIGTAVISNVAFPGAREQPGAFNDTSLKVMVDGHELELASDKRLLGKKPQPAFVYLDTSYTFPSKFPTVGYGPVAKAPYAWPGSKANGTVKGVAAEAPPIPENLRPVQVAVPCATPRPSASPSVAAGKPCMTAPAPKLPTADTH